jgi:Cft2 family RNA processing exonuclease
MIESDKGIRIKETNLWLDSKKKRELAFISHAHADHMVRHKRVIVSANTAILYQYRTKGKLEMFPLPFGEPMEIDGIEIELFPAGHILGSSQILIKYKGKRIVYTGDFKINGGHTAEPIKIKPCDVLIMEATYGRPHYLFPEVGEVIHRMIQFIEGARGEGKNPIFYAYQLGKSQEVVKVLGDRGYSLVVPRVTYEINKIYEACGISLKNYRLWAGPLLPEEILLIPPHLAHSKWVNSIQCKKTAILTGWAMDKETRYRFNVDEAFPFSDHADFAELLTYVMTVRPAKVYVTHGPAAFATYLKRNHVNAEYLGGKRQLTLWGDQ